MGVRISAVEGMGMSLASWRGRRVFLTGHTGFKGSWLSLWLQRCGALVTGYALDPPTIPSLFEEAAVTEGMTSWLGDIRDARALAEAVAEAAPEAVFHLAAQPLVRASYEDPVETYATNVMGTVHLLEAVRAAPSVKAAVIVTTDKCYQNREWLWGYREDEAMGGDDPYSASKGCAELVAASYRRSFFRGPEAAGIATARAGNVIGGGDWARDRLVPDILAAVRRGESVRIRYPGAIRPWQHVLEPLYGYMLLAEALLEGRAEAADAWNFGPDDRDARPVSWIADRVTETWGQDASWMREPGEHPHEAGLLKLDSSKARVRLGWMPRLDLASALEWTVAWHRNHADGGNAREQTLRDIERYEERLG